MQFFLIVFISSFAYYYIVPSFFFPSLTALSFVCWIWKDSITAQQIGSGLRGLRIGSKYKKCWARHNYILSAALDAGMAFTAVILYVTHQSRDIMGPKWCGLEQDDHCPSAKCPTAPGIETKGCPVL
ncbi:hypothetical protein ACFX2F_005710 [Malus domestica]